MRSIIQRYIISLLMLIIVIDVAGQPSNYEIVVYGATASGAIAAIAAADEGGKVLLIEPRRNVGGMVTGGLSHNDYGDRTVIGGKALDFYRQVAAYYEKPLYYWRGPEPHVGEKIFRDWLAEAGVKLLFERRVTEVLKHDGQISQITLSDGSIIKAKVFIDATYEGDLMARAGVSYTIGREGVQEYGESWAGRRAILPDGHQMLPRVNPFRNEKTRELLPLINPVPMVGEGQADQAVQGYGFRLTVTRDLDDMIPFPKPEKYHPDQFTLVEKYYQVHPDAGNMVHGGSTLPNGKSDMNSSGPISTNVIDGLNWEYPDADYGRRDEIWQEIKDYTLGLLYFLSYDPAIPERIRKDTRQMGLCKDEFVDNDHWPHQLYIRVGRRMKGEYFMTQHDLENDTIKYDAIGMGSYNIDVRHVQRTWIPVSRFPELHYEVFNEGYISIPVAPYEIPYRSLLPKYEECQNLIVPVCMSASHVAYASVRMEPQYMVMGQAAGVAAAMAAKENQPVLRINIIELQKRLSDQGQVLSLKENIYGAFNYKDEIIIDNNMKRFTEKSETWRGNETEHNGRYQMNYVQNDEQGTFSFKPWLEKAGLYELSIWYPSKKSYSDAVKILVNHQNGIAEKVVDQQNNGGEWMILGRYEFESGYQKVLTVVADDSNGTVVADAIKLRLIK